jgi:hypothetical protein
MAKKDEVFVRITNKQIYDEIQAHNKKIDLACDLVKEDLDITKQKVSFLAKLIWGSYGFTMFVLGVIINHLLAKI